MSSLFQGQQQQKQDSRLRTPISRLLEKNICIIPRQWQQRLNALKSKTLLCSILSSEPTANKAKNPAFDPHVPFTDKHLYLTLQNPLNTITISPEAMTTSKRIQAKIPYACHPQFKAKQQLKTPPIRLPPRCPCTDKCFAFQHLLHAITTSPEEPAATSINTD